MNTLEFQLIPKDNLISILPLLKQCDASIDEDTLKERFADMMSQNYHCVGLYDGDKLIGISGLWFLTKYYVGKHVEPDNVYILPEYQGKGLGHQLMEWIENYAKDQGCRAVELNCYTTNTKGQKFWEKEGYTRLGVHYQKILT